MLHVLAITFMLAASTLADGVVTEYGLTGFSANSYDPICATACLRCLYTMMLDCSSHGETVGMVDLMTSTECYAVNEPYLKSVAWCAHSRCQDFEPSAAQLEYWWDMQITGQKNTGMHTVPAKWTYGETLARISVAPSVQLLASDMMLNTTSLVPEKVYEAQFNVLTSTQEEGVKTNTYGIVMLVVGFGLPVFLTWLNYIPGAGAAIRRLRAYIIWPSTIGRNHVQSLQYQLGKPPTMGQLGYILLMLGLNIIFSAVNYVSKQPNAWNPTVHGEIMSYVLGRTGIFAYQLMPLVFLFASRNNILLWMTNWSHSTFMVLHRWLARIFTLQVLIHSIVSLAKYVQTDMYHHAVSQPYWIWGIVATLCVVILCFGSGLHVRVPAYQIFLVVHIVLSVILVVGCWYHAYDLYGMLGGYGYWVYATAAVWAFDRVGRLFRIWTTGLQHARITNLGDTVYARVDVPSVRWGLQPGMHAYLYFPTRTPWTPWENHPFSVMPTMMLDASTYAGKSVTHADDNSPRISEQADGEGDIEKRCGLEPSTHAIASTSPEMGITFFVRKGKGMEKLLRAAPRLLTLVEGPYRNVSCEEVLRCDRLLLIGGGIGITALVPFMANHFNVSLQWSVKESARTLVEELSGPIGQVSEKRIYLGSRLDIDALVQREAAAGWKKLGIVVSGPPQMCDDARASIVLAAKLHTRTEICMEVEGYSW